MKLTGIFGRLMLPFPSILPSTAPACMMINELATPEMLKVPSGTPLKSMWNVPELSVTVTGIA